MTSDRIVIIIYSSVWGKSQPYKLPLQPYSHFLSLSYSFCLLFSELEQLHHN